MTVRTRFAPSPTGYLHIGGARTALFAYLFARHQQGEFLLRIEDTDGERSTEEAVEAIFNGMYWLGLEHDGEVVRQSQRLERYRQVMAELVAAGKAYYCSCSKERVEQLRLAQMAAKQKPRYDGHCRELGLAAQPNYVVRFKNPLEGKVKFHDLVLGDIEIVNQELDDLIIARSDQTPTYNFTVVVDDMDSNITHVIRGMDHVNNTPRQINLLHALNAPVPHYGHLPMIHGSDGQKLSKRHGAVSVMQYREEGFLPQALLNGLVRLGWSHGDKEIFSREEMIELFSLQHVSRSPAIFNPDKLLWLNQHYLKTLPASVVAPELDWHFKELNIDAAAGPMLTDLLPVYAERTKTLKELVIKSSFLYQQSPLYEEKAAAKYLTPAAQPLLLQLYEWLAALEDWQASAIHQHILMFVAQQGSTLGQIAQLLRIAVSGDTVSPPIDQTLWLLGKDKTRERLLQAAELCKGK